LSSAILYLAIVAIWACVLIPRWLKRDSVRGAGVAAERPAAHQDTAILELTDADAEQLDTQAPEQEDEDDDAPPPAVPEPLSREESRRRMVTARRRLLVMLIGLEIAAVALAVLGLAAVWVVVPPSLMLVGYLLLLREAARADRELAEREAEAAAQRHAREDARMRAKTAKTAVPASGAALKAEEQAEELAARFAAAPVAADHEDSAPGRDFAPGLAGKYTTSQAESDPADEDYYEVPRLRAVGD
jgi:hypothetical protein